jgi:polyferredoxin
LFALGSRERINLAVLRDRNPVWVRLSDGAIRNSYTIKIRNMEDRPRRMELALSGMPGGVLWDEAHARGTGTRLAVDAGADQVVVTRVFVAGPAKGEEREEFTLAVRAIDSEGGAAKTATIFERPEEDD